jgi:two-component system chemotaxis response regulator CheY
MDVLIVDDSAAIRKILRRVLRQTGLHFVRIHEAGDGVEALQCLRFNKVQLILSDINMPNMDGLQLLSELKSNSEWKDVPIVMITTEGRREEVLKAVQLGASSYIRKPFTAAQIKEKLTQATLDAPAMIGFHQRPRTGKSEGSPSGLAG